MSQTAVLTILRRVHGCDFVLQPPGPRVAPFCLHSPVAAVQNAEESLLTELDQVAHLLDNLSVQRQPQPQPNGATHDLLLPLGRMIYSQLLPPAIQEALRDLSAETSLVFATDDPLPWELAHDGEDYLALRHAVSRQILLPRHDAKSYGTAQGDWSALIIGNPNGDLPEAGQEGESLERLIAETAGTSAPRLLLRKRATRATILQELLGKPYDLVHYSGHAVLNEDEPQKSGLLLAGDEILTVAEISQGLAGQPFVFLNACESARDREKQADHADLIHVSRAGLGLVGAFVRSGAQAVIGTVWPIRDAGSRDFALSFYRLALSGHPAGEALRLARAGARAIDPSSPLWAAFSYYGDPGLILVSVPRVEHRPATVLVVRTSGLDSLHTQVGGYEAARTAGLCAASLTAQVARYGGQVYSLAHDTLIAIFGLPIARENDAQRALRAAYEMVAEFRGVAASGVSHRGLDLGIGISSGEVFNSTVGESSLATAMGEPVQQAVCLAHQSDHQAILLSASTRRLVGRFGDIIPQGQLRPPSGKSFAVYRFLGITPETILPWQEHPATMVGRGAELTMLQDAFSLSRQGRGQLVSIVGEPGVGKSRLLYEFRQSLGTDTVRWLAATCPSSHTPAAYEVLAQLLRSAIDLSPGEDATATRAKVQVALQNLPGQAMASQDVAADLALLADLLTIPFPDTPALTLEPKIRQRRVADLLGRLLARHALAQPVIVALEDLQWLDDASRNVLSQLAGRVEALRVMVISVVRSDAEWQPSWWKRPNHRLLILGALDEAESRSLLSVLLGQGRIGSETAALLSTQAAGNPLFLRELVATLAERGDLVLNNGEWRVLGSPESAQVPDTVQRVILARFGGLPAEGQRVLPLMAVVGDKANYRLLSAVLSETEDALLLDEGLGQLEGRGFVHASVDGDYHFHHALFREVAYASIPADVRPRLHLRVARILESFYAGREAEGVELLAHHYDSSEERVGAIRYGLLAARRAADSWANQAALRWYERSLSRITGFAETPPGETEQEHGATPDQTLQWHVGALEGKADVLAAIGHNTEATVSYGEALALLEATDRACAIHEAALHRKIAIARHNQGELDAAQAEIDAGLAILGGSACPEAGRLHVWKGLLLFRRGRFESALEECRQGVALVQPADSLGDLAQAYNLEGVIYRNMGECARALVAHERSIVIYEQVGDIAGQERAYSNLGCVYQDLGRWEEALRYFEKSSLLCERTGESRRQAAAAINLGEIYRRQGKLDQAIAVYERARQIGEEMGSAEAVGLTLMNLGASYLRLGHLRMAADLLEDSLGIFNRIGTEVHLPEVIRCQAELRLLQGQAAEALDLGQEALERSVQLKRRLEEGQARRLLGQACRALGRLAEADEHLARSLAILEEQDNLYERALTQWELAALRNDQVAVSREPEKAQAEAAAFREQALAIFARLGVTSLPA